MVLLEFLFYLLFSIVNHSSESIYLLLRFHFLGNHFIITSNSPCQNWNDLSLSNYVNVDSFFFLFTYVTYVKQITLIINKCQNQECRLLLSSTVPSGKVLEYFSESYASREVRRITARLQKTFISQDWK